MESEHGPVARYVHRPLSQDEIRLVHLLPGDEDDALRLQIVHVKLSELSKPPDRVSVPKVQQTLSGGWRAHRTPEGRLFFTDVDDNVSYTHPTDKDSFIETTVPVNLPDHDFESLSYAWGSPTLNKSALVLEANESEHASARSVNITRNLYIALRHLRRQDRRRTLWTDALCINQEDAEEKRAQILRMREIYGSASRVLVWLGPASQDSSLALSRLRFLGQQAEISQDNWVAPSPEAEEPCWCEGDVLLPYKIEDWQALERFFRRSWFKRLWAIQEISVANEHAVMQCGHETVTWYLLRRAIAVLEGKVGVPPNLTYLVGNKVGIAHGQRNTHLMEIIYMSRQHSCTDPRDKLYGMLGLLGTKILASFQPSYHRSFEEIYRELFLEHSKISGRLELLAQCFYNDEQSGSLPSWVPDLRAFPFLFRMVDYGFQAAGVSRSYFECSANKLSAIGLVCGSVTSVYEGAEIDSASLTSKTQEIWSSALQFSKTYVTGEEMMQAWSRTLCLDHTDQRYPDDDAPPTSERRQLVRNIVTTEPSGSSDLNRKITHQIRDTLTEMRFFTATTGYFGFGPASMTTGDRVCVVLGVHAPIIVRPITTTYLQVVGWAYVHGLMDGEALLGPLPSGWMARQLWIDSRYQVIFVDEAGSYHADDPRLEPLSDVWECISDRENTADDPICARHYRNTETGEYINYDPRMTLEYLKSRGVPLQQLDFI